mgnify:CR=1 FL=1
MRVSTVIKNIYLGMDLGTTNTKVLAIDENGKQIAIASNETIWHTKPGGRVEANPEEIFHTCLQTIYDVIEKVKSQSSDVNVKALANVQFAFADVFAPKKV